VHTGFWWEDLRERDHLEDLGMVGKNKIKMNNVEIGWECMEWIDLVLDTGTWWAFVKAVISLRVP
jgi:hypothetical protein